MVRLLHQTAAIALIQSFWGESALFPLPTHQMKCPQAVSGVIYKMQFCCKNINKRIMFDQDIFESQCFFTQAVLQPRKMSSQHQSIFDCLLHTPKSIPQKESPKIQDMSPDLCFTQIEFYPQNNSKPDPQLINYGLLIAEFQQEQRAVCQNRYNRVSCNNIASYILKHCFKQILSSTYRKEVELICLQENISYFDFIANWKQQSKHIQKHFGVNNLLKMFKNNYLPHIQVVRYFLMIYLRYQYPLYLMGKNNGRKELYIEVSVKLLYLMDASIEKYQRIVMLAQSGPKHR